MYLNIILTILCLILLSIMICLIYFWKKYLKKFFNNDLKSPFHQISDERFDDPFKMVNELLRNIPRR